MKADLQEKVELHNHILSRCIGEKPLHYIVVIKENFGCHLPFDFTTAADGTDLLMMTTESE